MSQITLETQAEQAEHPNFIEANTSGITLEELSQHIVPTFGDGTLTLSSCGIINATMKAAREIFGDLTEPEIRVSHKINGSLINRDKGGLIPGSSNPGFTLDLSQPFTAPSDSPSPLGPTLRALSDEKAFCVPAPGPVGSQQV